MSRTIHEGFSTFHGWLTPTGTESENAKSHRDSIQSCLKNNFGLNYFFRCGSFGNGTSITAHSDTDYIASIPPDNLKSNSASALSDVRAALAARFPNTVGIRTNTPAVRVPFGSLASETTEVVPAKLHDVVDEQLIYKIADGAGGWMKTSPGAHNAYVKAVNDSLGGKVKPLIRFLKAWKYYNDVPISSFYLEMRVAHYASSQSSIVYIVDLEFALRRLYDCDLAAMQDPVGIAGYIRPCSTEAKLAEAKSKLLTAYTRANKAREADVTGETSDAFYWLNLLFNGRFPAYNN